MSLSSESAESSFSSLPPDVLLDILSYCDTTSLGRLSSVCQRLQDVIKQDYVWLARSKRVIATNQVSSAIQKRSQCYLSAREKCRISVNWRLGIYSDEPLLVHRILYIPWLQLCGKRLWHSKGSAILCSVRRPDGGLSNLPRHKLRGHLDDVCKFVCKDGILLSGGRDGALCGWEENTGRFLFSKRCCHGSDINSVDVWKNICISGSKDKTIKVWSVQNHSITCQYSVAIRDRVWSVAISPCGRRFFSGSAGYHNIPPLQVLDLETGTKLYNLGNDYRNGAGVLHICPESASETFSCGYDTYIRLWDSRTTTHCVQEWEDPHDSAVYCVTSDGSFTFMSGTSRHGLVRLWDRRMTKSIQMYYVGQGNSPVYSLSFDPSYMYVAVDRSLNVLKFTGRYSTRSYNHSNIFY